MKCNLHPFYPRKYCWGCKYKDICEICGEKKYTRRVKAREEGEKLGNKEDIIAINICEDCYSSIFKKEKIRSYDGRFVIYVKVDSKRNRFLKIKCYTKIKWG